MLSAVREVEVAVVIDWWAVDLSDARGGRSLGSMETVAVAGRVDLRTPVVCAVLGWVLANLPMRARNSGPPKKVGLLQERTSAPKSRNRHARCAALAQISESGLRCESKSVGFTSPIEPIEPKSNGATTDTRGGRG